MLVGRSAEAHESEVALQRLRAGHGGVVLFVGEAGIGKTTLADAMSANARAAGVRVAWGRCWEAGGAPPFWPWTQIFRALGEEDPFASVTEAAVAEASDVRFRVFDQVAERLRSLARAAPLLLVLDDLHAADMPTLVLLQFVARSLRGGARVGIVGTYRDAEARLAGEAGAVLAKIARDAAVCAPARLTQAEVGAWVRAREPDASDVLVERIFAASEGNPLFVDELFRVRSALAVATLPDGLRAVLDEHLARVSDDVRALAAAAAVFGREASDAGLVALTGATLDDVVERARLARAAGLLVAAGPARHAFTHMLLRDRLYDTIPRSRRVALHRAAGEYFAAAGDDASATHHFFEAGAHDAAVSAARAAGRAALARLAFEEADAIATRALAVAPEQGALAAELTLLRAEALVRMGKSSEGRTVALRAAELAEAAGEHTMMAHAALVHGVDIVSATVDPAQVALLRRVASVLEDRDDPLRARVLARLAASLVPVTSIEQFHEANGLADAALAMARRCGDPDALLFVLRYVTSAKGYGVATSERYALVEETIALATALDRSSILIELLSFHAAILRERGDRAGCERALDRWAALIRANPRPQYEWRLPLVFAGHALLDGDVERAERVGDEARVLAEASGQVPGLTGWAMFRLAMAVLRDDLTTLAADAGKVLAILDRVPPFRFMRALLLVAQGREAEARPIAASFQFDPRDVPRVCMAAATAIALNDDTLAARVLDPLRDASLRTAIFWGAQASCIYGPLSLWAGILLGRAGRSEEARAYLDAAADVATRLACPLLVASVARARAQLAPSAPATPSPASRPRGTKAVLTIEQEGDVWRIASSAHASVTLKDAKGLHYLAELVRSEGRDLHVTQLVGLEHEAGDAGPVLDAKAKEAYRARFEALRDQNEEAVRFGDVARASRIEAEMEALAEQLAAAVGLGGRDRKAGSHVERARINVQRRLRDVFRRVGEQNPELGRYVEACVKTGVWCSFRPV